MELALFDFDGTITTKDSTIEFIIKYSNKLKLIISPIIFLPLGILLLIRLINFPIVKEIILIYFFKNWSKEKFDATVNKYLANQMPHILRPKAIEKIQWHKNRKHNVVIVTGAIDLLLKPWCEKNEINLIATGLEVTNKKITGRMSTPNCRGIEKVRRIKEKYKLEDYSKIYAYGNSSGDKEMLDIADEKYYRYFEK